MSLPLILLPGEGRSVRIGTKTTCTFKVTGKDTSRPFGSVRAWNRESREHVHISINNSLRCATWRTAR